MMISYKPGSLVLERLWRRGEFIDTRLLVLFLGSEYDRSFLEEVIKYARDLDHLFYEKICIGLLFMPPPDSGSEETAAVSEFERFFKLNWNKDSELIERFVKQMSQESYDLARLLGIPLHDMPSIAFLSASEPGRIAYLPLAHSSLSEVYVDLRRVMNDWYDDNRTQFARYRADLHQAQHHHVADFANQVAIQLERDNRANHMVRKLPNAIARAQEDPSCIRNLMIRHGFSVEIDGITLDGNAVKQRIIELRSLPVTPQTALPDFDLARIRRISRKIRFQHAATIGAARSTGILEWIKKLREAFFPGI